MIDLVISQQHPRIAELSANGTAAQNRVIPCTGDWATAIESGQAEWICLVDSRTDAPDTDLAGLERKLPQSAESVSLLPTHLATSAEQFIWQACPPRIAALWNNPVLHAIPCLQRSMLGSLPRFDQQHPEVIWDWLSRAAIQGQPIKWSTATAPAEIWQWSGAELQALPKLSPATETRAAWLIDRISSLKPSQLVIEKTSEADSVALKAGLLQWHDALDASHQLSQSVEGLGKHQAGDYWHAIMHRREPDYSNAKYWFRQLGSHSVFSQLLPHAGGILDNVAGGAAWKARLTGNGVWNPLVFVDLCQACADQDDTPLGLAARQIQAAEMHLLLASTYRDACVRN